MTSKETIGGHLFLRLLWPFTALGRAPLIGPLLGSLSRAILPRRTRIWVQVRRGPGKGLWMRVNPRTGRDLYQGTRELMVQETLAEYLRSGMVFYDLGANIGLFSLIGARSVGQGGKVFAFEPDPDVCQRLRENVSRNGFSNVEIVQAAVSSSTGSTDFIRADPQVSPDLGVGRIDTAHVGAGTIRVLSVALRDFVQHAPPPDVIKCDVEGAEVEVFEGSRALLEAQRPLVVCELHSSQGAELVTTLLADIGYAVRPLGKNHILALP